MKRQIFAAMRPLRMLSAALVLSIGFSAASFAQSVLVMNEQRILRESAVGQHIAARLEAIGAEIQAELQPQQAAIQSESEALNAELSALSEDAIRQRPRQTGGHLHRSRTRIDHDKVIAEPVHLHKGKLGV